MRRPTGQESSPSRRPFHQPSTQNALTAPCKAVGVFTCSRTCRMPLMFQSVRQLSGVFACHTAASDGQGDRTWWRHGAQRGCLLWSLVTLSVTLAPSFSGVGWCRSSNNTLLIVGNKSVVGKLISGKFSHNRYHLFSNKITDCTCLILISDLDERKNYSSFCVLILLPLLQTKSQSH